MRTAPVARVVAAGLTRRRRPAIVIGLLLAFTAAASVLAAALVVDVRGPFDHVFAAQHGAYVTVTADLSRATMAQLAATARLPGVTAATGPFAEASIGRPGTPVTVRQGGPGGIALAPMTLAGRASAGGPVDDPTLVTGHWARQAGQIVLRFGYQGGHIPVGSWLTVTGLPGAPRLEVVGLAVSISGSADAWVIPAEITRLRPPGTPGTAQMLYRFDGAATAAAIGADVDAVSAALPAGAVTGTRSYLTVKAADTARVAVYVPLLIACGLAGLVLALLTVASVISGAVTAGSTRIRILKIIGFSPGQVAAAYAGQGLVPAAAGCMVGVLAGNLLARPLLAGAASVFGPGVLGVPAWVDVDVTVVMFGLTALAALAPARRLTRVP
jgi:putative ABC transport system permease protein